MAKRYAAQALAEWWKEHRGKWPNQQNTKFDILRLVPMKLLDELLREHNEM